MTNKHDTKERTFTGCWSCRLRKRKCDVRKPVCSLCAKQGLPCSYEVRLVWLDDNIYRTTDDDIIDVLCLNKKRNKVVKNKKHGLSKSEFQHIIHSNQLLNNGESAPNNSANNDDQSFTISVRRFQVYNNEVRSVFGSKSNRCFDQKIIDKRLTRLLNSLESTIECNYTSTNIDYRQGPFSAFHISSSNSLINTNDTNSPIGTLSNTDSSVFSPRSDISHETLSIDNSMEQLSNINKIHLDINQLEELYTDPNNEIVEPQSPLTYLNIRSKPPYSEETREQRIVKLLMTYCTNNMILGRQEYANWFLNHMKQICDTKEDSYHLIDEILIDSQITGAETYINKLIDFGHEYRDLQIIGLTIIVVLHGFYNDIGSFKQLESWVLCQKCLSYSMYPLINFIINNSDSFKIFNHCHYLVNTLTESEDLYQDSLTFELDRLITEKLVEKWRERIFLQLVLDEDITESTAQLKYWQLQAKCNEQFYKDVYSLTEMYLE